jgi:hypothetical protein
MLNDGGYLDWTFDSTSKRQLRPGNLCKGIILFYDPGNPHSIATNVGPAVLICDRVGDTMERVGIYWVNKLETVQGDWVWSESTGWQFIRTGPPAPQREPLDLVKTWEEVHLG